MSDEQKTVEVPEKFKALVAEIEKMSVLDLAELVKVLNFLVLMVCGVCF